MCDLSNFLPMISNILLTCQWMDYVYKCSRPGIDIDVCSQLTVNLLERFQGLRSYECSQAFSPQSSQDMPGWFSSAGYCVTLLSSLPAHGCCGSSKGLRTQCSSWHHGPADQLSHSLSFLRVFLPSPLPAINFIFGRCLGRNYEVCIAK